MGLAGYQTALPRDLALFRLGYTKPTAGRGQERLVLFGLYEINPRAEVPHQTGFFAIADPHPFGG